MSRDPLDTRLRGAIVRWTEDSAPPVIDLSAIRRRAFRLLQHEPRSRRSLSPRAAIAISVIVATLLAAAPSLPAIVGNVSRTFHAFAIGNGRIQTAKTRSVSLEQARKDMPFTVLTPAGLPRSLQTNITEVYPSPKRADAQLWFDFTGSAPRTALTILEMSATSPYAAPMSQAAPPPHQGEVVVTQARSGQRLTASAIAVGAPSTCISIKIAPSGTPLVRTVCEPPVVAGHGHPLVTSSAGERGASLNTEHTVTEKGAMVLSGARLPIRWVANGTLVVLFDPAGVLSPEQVRALRAAMSR
jgi:hypothetical protein